MSLLRIMPASSAQNFMLGSEYYFAELQIVPIRRSLHPFFGCPVRRNCSFQHKFIFPCVRMHYICHPVTTRKPDSWCTRDLLNFSISFCGCFLTIPPGQKLLFQILPHRSAPKVASLNFVDASFLLLDSSHANSLCFVLTEWSAFNKWLATGQTTFTDWQFHT